MELDEYLNSLNADLERQMAELNNSVANALNRGTSQISVDAAESSAAEISFCPECGTRIEAGSNFCPNCGTNLSHNAIQDKAESDSNEIETEIEGIIFTNSTVLAEKYDCDVEDVYDILEDFISNSADVNHNWHLLDAAKYSQQLGKHPSWLDYNQLISDFMQEIDLSYGMKTPVFIIGGDDVIPIPKIEDLYGTSDDGLMPCDMCYCFEDHFFSDLWEGDHAIVDDYIRNNVSRLPLEDGELESSIEEDLGGYFDLCSSYYEEGIPVEHVMMTANASWLPASKTMSEHLPLINHADDEDFVEDGMYVSPPVSPDNEEAEEALGMSLYKAGMLLFNLHGTDEEGLSSFYNDIGEAFSKDSLEDTDARVFNTVACYGARYHGYERDDSMLLTALYNQQFLLYAGSLIPVPMTELRIPEGVEVHAGSGSEHLMPIYCMEQFAGLPTGEAMMKAKIEYFNTFRHLERDDFSLATIQMFSLYGNPMLKVQRNEDVLRRAEEEHVLPVLPDTYKNIPIRMKRLQRIMTKDNTSGSLLAEIRGAVNANLDAIHSSIAKNLYAQLGLEPRMLNHIDAYSIPNGDGTTEKGFMYAYVDENRAFANKIWVEVDENGKLRRVIKTK